MVISQRCLAQLHWKRGRADNSAGFPFSVACVNNNLRQREARVNRRGKALPSPYFLERDSRESSLNLLFASLPARVASDFGFPAYILYFAGVAILEFFPNVAVVLSALPKEDGSNGVSTGNDGNQRRNGSSDDT